MESEREEKVISFLQMHSALFGKPVLAKRLLEKFGTPREVLSASTDGLRCVSGISEKAISGLKDSSHLEFAEKELKRCKEMGIKIILIEDKDYPQNLKEIEDPPILLYCKGELKREDEQSVAVVGSRDPDEYGRAMARKFGAGLGRAGVTVVSGMARGVDSIAQISCVSEGGRTIAVFGSGIDVIYPSEHKELAMRIAENGALLSEFPLGAGPLKHYFPFRNRLISGMAKGVIVVQATSPQSGALITARLALEQNRTVFAVPGNAGLKNSQQTNQLIREGAILAEKPEDILEDLFPLLFEKQEIKKMPLFKEKGADLTESLEQIYSLIPSPSEGAVELDFLIRKSGLSTKEVNSAITELELYGLIEVLPGKKLTKKEVC